MVGSVNKVILIGNLGRDPEVRYSQDGTKIVTLSIATSESWKDRSSRERRERTEWHRVVIFNPKLADIAERYLHKGSKAYLEGILQTRKWTDQSGIERYTTEIVIGRFRGELVLLDGRSGSGGSGVEPQPPYGLTTEHDDAVTPRLPAGGGEGSTDSNGGVGWDRSPDLDDEIPF